MYWEGKQGSEMEAHQGSSAGTGKGKNGGSDGGVDGSLPRTLGHEEWRE